MLKFEGVNLHPVRPIPRVVVRPGRAEPLNDRGLHSTGVSSPRSSSGLSNFNTYPDFSTVTLPSRNASVSMRLSLISVNPYHQVPNSIDASNLSESGAYGDDVVEALPQCCWYRNVVRMGTIGDGSCFFHAVLKAGSPEYQKNNSYNFRTRHALMLRRDLAYLLTLPNPRYPTEDDARRMLWKAYNLDSDESLIRYLNNLQMITFPEPPRIPTQPPSDNADSAREWHLYESGRRKWQEHNYPLARKYAYDHDILDCRRFLGDGTQRLQLNSYYFTLREGKLPELAIMRKNQLNEPHNDAGWSMDFPDLYQLVSILINPSRYVGDTDVVGWFAEVANVDLYFCHVYNDRIIPNRIVKAENAIACIVINNSGGSESGHESTHFETMGVVTSGESESIQTIFPLDHPFLQAFQEQMQSGLRGCSRSASLTDLSEQMGGELGSLAWGVLHSPNGRSSEGGDPARVIINIPVPHLPDARTLPASPKSVASGPRVEFSDLQNAPRRVAHPGVQQSVGSRKPPMVTMPRRS